MHHTERGQILTCSRCCAIALALTPMSATHSAQEKGIMINLNSDQSAKHMEVTSDSDWA